ncbi:MAG TPA: Gfo/Idh/MocA family oxidoreductase [Chloroflexia bacterium]|nr:Gfo/Idh/MocA family oxidoreductase [Chloroflexia bacterium]
MTNWGLIGLGKIAQVRIAPAFARSPTEHLVAVAGRDPARTAAFAAQHSAAPQTIAGLLADPTITAVYIAAANDLHAEYTIAAAAAGKHVLCEKPLARTLDEAEAMVDACRSAGVLLGTAFMMRFHPLHRQVHDLIAGGAIGTPLQARVQNGFGLQPQRQTWRVDRRASGGGPLMDVGSHAVDLLCYVTGARVTEVGAFTGRQVLPGDAEDAAVVNLVLDTGLLAQVNVAFNTPFSRTSLEIHGTLGSLVTSGTLGQVAAGEAQLVTAAGTQPLTYVPCDLYQAELEAFGQAVRGAAPLAITGTAGLENLRVLRAAYRSSYWGGSATLPADPDTPEA